MTRTIPRSASLICHCDPLAECPISLGSAKPCESIANGWRGVVIHGAIRDSAGLRPLALGVMALAATPCRGWTPQPSQAGCSVDLVNTLIEPGMWIYADVDGVIVARVELDLKSS